MKIVADFEYSLIWSPGDGQCSELYNSTEVSESYNATIKYYI